MDTVLTFTTADEARLLQNSYVQQHEVPTSLYQTINEHIQIAAKAGKSSVTFYMAESQSQLAPTICKYLQERGYMACVLNATHGIVITWGSL